MSKLSITYFEITNINGKETPLIIRTNVMDDSKPIGSIFGIDLYWSFTEERPSYESHDGAVTLGKIQKISPSDKRRFSQSKIYFATYAF